MTDSYIYTYLFEEIKNKAQPQPNTIPTQRNSITSKSVSNMYYILCNRCAISILSKRTV